MCRPRTRNAGRQRAEHSRHSAASCLSSAATVRCWMLIGVSNPAFNSLRYYGTPKKKTVFFSCFLVAMLFALFSVAAWQCQHTIYQEHQRPLFESTTICLCVASSSLTPAGFVALTSNRTTVLIIIIGKKKKFPNKGKKTERWRKKKAGMDVIRGRNLSVTGCKICVGYTEIPSVISCLRGALVPVFMFDAARRRELRGRRRSIEKFLFRPGLVTTVRRRTKWAALRFFVVSEQVSFFSFVLFDHPSPRVISFSTYYVCAFACDIIMERSYYINYWWCFRSEALFFYNFFMTDPTNTTALLT